MSDLNMNIVIGATVNQATQGLKTVSHELANTAMAAQKVDSSVAKTSTAFSALGGIASNVGNVFSELLPDIVGLATGFGAAQLVVVLVSEAMKLMTAQTRAADEQAKQFTETFKALETETNSINKELGNFPTALDNAQAAIEQVNSRLIELRETFKTLNEPGSDFLAFIKGGFGAGAALREEALREQKRLIEEQKKGFHDLGEAQLAEQAKTNIALNALADEQVIHDLQIAKQRNDSIASDSRAGFSKRLAALKESLNEELQINAYVKDKELQQAGDSLIKIKTLEENFRFANLKAQQDYSNSLIHLQEQQASAAEKAAAAAERAAEKERKRIEDFNKALNDLRRFKDIPIAAPFELKIKPVITPLSEIEAQASLIKMRDALEKAGGKVFSNQGILTDVKLLNDDEVLKNFTALTDKLAASTFLVRDAFDAVFNSLQSGKNVFDSIGQALSGLVKKLAATVVEAIILDVVLSLITGGGFAAVTIKGIISQFKGLIPGFATGGVVTRPTLAMVGEQGPERITPLNQISNSSSNILAGEVIFQIHGQTLRGVLQRANQTSSFIN